MNNNRSKKAEEAPVSVNTQMMIGVVIVGVMMFRFNNKMNTMMRSQMRLTEGVKLLTDGVISIDEELANFTKDVVEEAVS